METDSEGTVITVVDGWLYVGPHEGTDAYDLYLDRKYEYGDGTSNIVHSLFSSGTYSWDGETLTFTDESADKGPIMVTLSNLGSKVTLLMQGRVYEFGKLSSLPGGP